MAGRQLAVRGAGESLHAPPDVTVDWKPRHLLFIAAPNFRNYGTAVEGVFE